jgi:hypothetical protein
MFCRVQVPIGGARPAILIPDRALGTDQGQKYLYIVADGVNDKGQKQETVEYRKVTTGSPHNGLRVIESGLKMGEKVVVNGLQRVRPGAVVESQMAEPKAGDTLGAKSGQGTGKAAAGASGQGGGAPAAGRSGQGSGGSGADATAPGK